MYEVLWDVSLKLLMLLIRATWKSQVFSLHLERSNTKRLINEITVDIA